MTTNKEVAIEEMLRDAEEAAEPGDTKAGAVINTTQDMTMTAAELQSAGYVYVYDTVNGKSSIVNRNMLPQILQKTRPDGTYVFSTRKPEGIEPVVGTMKCYMHPDDPDREKYTSMGVIVCKKDDFLNELDRLNHLKNRHPRAYATLELERTRLEREEDRLERMALADSIREINKANTTKGSKNG